LPAQMFHVGWNRGEQGATFTDLVFPWFIFIAGVAIPFSMGGGRGRALSRPQRLLVAGRRAVVIYTLGLLLDAATSGQLVFLKWNILQMIAGAYLIGTCLSLLPFAAQAVFVGCTLAAKWYVLSVMPHPDYGSSVWHFAVDGGVVPDRYAEGSVPVNGEQVFKSRLLASEASLPLSDAINFSPLLNWLCNLFNLLPAAAVCVLGMWAGRFIRSDRERRPRTGWVLVIAGCTAWLASWAWNLHHPWSKDFFTASYALLAAGTAAGLLGTLFLLLDSAAQVRTRWLGVIAALGVLAGGIGVMLDVPVWVQSWSYGVGVGGAVLWFVGSLPVALRFFRVFGLNAIAVYFVNEMLFKLVFTAWSLPALDPDASIIGAVYGLLRADRFAHSQAETLLGSWAFALFWLLGCWLFVRWLDRRGVYIRV
ncbi:MAG: hypothetical protein AAF937_04950, partial [Planctomycetota bacterium]